MCLFGYYMAKLKGFNYQCCSKSVVTTSRSSCDFVLASDCSRLNIDNY